MAYEEMRREIEERLRRKLEEEFRKRGLGATICERLPQTTLSKMKELVLRGAEEGVEYGAYILRDLTLSEPVRGGRYYVRFPEPPPDAVGMFHTHGKYTIRTIGECEACKVRIIEGEVHLSETDALNFLAQKFLFSCIGTLKNSAVTIGCWELKMKDPFVRDFVESAHESIDEFLKKVLELAKKYKTSVPVDILSDEGFDIFTKNLENVATEEEIDDLLDLWVEMWAYASDISDEVERGGGTYVRVCERVLE